MATKLQIRINKPGGKTQQQTYAQVTNSGIEPDTEGDTFMDARSLDLEESETARRELLGQLIHAFSIFEIWTPTNPSVFVSTIPSYNYNQELNRDHVKALAKCIMETREIIGVLITCEFEDGTIILIDGHHRLEALKAIILEKGPGFLNLIPIVIHNYKSDHKDSPRTLALFHKINTVKPYTLVKSVDQDCLLIITQLKARFPEFKEGLRDTGKSRTTFPYVLESEFKCALEAKLKELVTYNRDNVIEQIAKYNMELGCMARTPNGWQHLMDATVKDEVLKRKLSRLEEKKFYLATKPGTLWPLKIKG
jgi:hypothetical protein